MEELSPLLRMSKLAAFCSDKTITSCAFHSMIIFYINKMIDDRQTSFIQCVDIELLQDWLDNNKYESLKIISYDQLIKLNSELISIYSNSYKKRETTLLELGIERSRILPMTRNDIDPRDKYQFFNLEYRLRLKESNFSIIANDCWGGFVYNQLGLAYNTPFIWLYLDHNYMKLLKNLKHYLSCDLSFVELPGINHPVGMLDDIFIYFNHYKTNEEAREKWVRRLQRFNDKNVFVKMTIEDEKTAIEFERLDIKNKIAFTNQDFNLESCIFMDGWQDENIRNQYVAFWQYVQMESNKYFDFVKWLNGEDGRLFPLHVQGCNL